MVVNNVIIVCFQDDIINIDKDTVFRYESSRLWFIFRDSRIIFVDELFLLNGVYLVLEFSIFVFITYIL